MAMTKVYVITFETEELYKNGRMERSYEDHYVEGVYLTKESAVKKLQEYCNEARATEEYKNHMTHEIYDVGERYYVEYDYRALVKWKDYILTEMEAI